MLPADSPSFHIGVPAVELSADGGSRRRTFSVTNVADLSKAHAIDVRDDDDDGELRDDNRRPQIELNEWEMKSMITTVRQSNPTVVGLLDDDDAGRPSPTRMLGAARAWIRRHVLILTAMILSLIATIVVWVVVDPNNTIKLNNTNLWVWFALTGMVVLVYLICGVLERLILWAIHLSFPNPPWGLVIILGAFRNQLRLLLFTVSLDAFLINWFNTYGGAIDNLGGGSVDKVARSCLRSVYTVALILILLNIMIALIEFSFTKKSFEKRVADVNLQADSLQRLWCRTDADHESLQAYWASDRERHQFMCNVGAIQHNPLSLCLDQKLVTNDATRSSTRKWVFSPNAIVDIATTREMAMMVRLLFDDIAEDDTESDERLLAFERWSQFFPAHAEAKQAFVKLFANNSTVIQNRVVTKDEFVAAWLKVFKTRMILANRLKSFANLFNVIRSVATSVGWVLMGFVVAAIFHYDIGQVVTATSAFMISIAFGTSKSVSRAVESIIFVFVSQPYQVSDQVMIGGSWMVVESIGVLETKFRDASNVVIRFSNQTLADLQIANFTTSHQAISRIKTQIALETPVEKIELLRAAVLKYTVTNAAVWKPGRVAIFQNAMTNENMVELEVKVESIIEWEERVAFRMADSALTGYVREMLTSLNIRYKAPNQEVTITTGRLASVAGDPVLDDKGKDRPARRSAPT